MSEETNTGGPGNRWRLSLDSWAVLLALLIALLVRTGVFKHVPW
ncbi:MAG TPA: hypothetical protein VK805_03875 [Candidatus Baltobacteraceae bacterium]|jgi:hypothetical protein|nr:hypothetical protein [Candidatus Baltobacteraceae bacterium]